MAFISYKDYFSSKNPSNRIKETAILWYRSDGSPKTRAMTETMIVDAMKRYKIGLQEAAEIIEKSMVFFKNDPVSDYWGLVSRLAEAMHFDIQVPVHGAGSTKMFAHYDSLRKIYSGFAPTEVQAKIYSRNLPVEEVVVSKDNSGKYWGFWKDGRYEMVSSSLEQIKYNLDRGEVDEVEEDGQLTRVSVSGVKHMSEAGVAPDHPPPHKLPRSSTAEQFPGANLANMNKIFGRIKGNQTC